VSKLNWTLFPLADGSGDVLIRESGESITALAFESVDLPRGWGQSPESDERGAWSAKEWTCVEQEREFDIQRTEPCCIIDYRTQDVVGLVGQEHIDWIKSTLIGALMRLRRLQEASAEGAPDETLARKAAKAEGRLRDELRSVWPELAEASVLGLGVREDAPSDVESFLALLPSGPSRVAVRRRDDSQLVLCPRAHAHRVLAAILRRSFWERKAVAVRPILVGVFAVCLLFVSVAFVSAQSTQVEPRQGTARTITLVQSISPRPRLAGDKRNRNGGRRAADEAQLGSPQLGSLVPRPITAPPESAPTHEEALQRSGQAAPKTNGQKTVGGSSTVTPTGGVEVSGSANDSADTHTEEPKTAGKEVKVESAGSDPESELPVGEPTKLKPPLEVGSSGGSSSPGG
jgi:hypothetical protein